VNSESVSVGTTGAFIVSKSVGAAHVLLRKTTKAKRVEGIILCIIKRTDAAQWKQQEQGVNLGTTSTR